MCKVFCLFVGCSGSVVWHLILIWGNSHYCFKYFFVFLSLFSFLYSHYVQVIHFAVLYSWVFCLFFFFTVLFNFGVFIEIFSIRDSFLRHVQFARRTHQILSSFSQYVFYLQHFFWLLFQISISLLTLPISSCMLLTLSIRTHRVLIIVVLKISI